MPIAASLMRGLLHGLSMLFGSLGITCLFCSFWVPAIGGYAFVMLATATGITLALDPTLSGTRRRSARPAARAQKPRTAVSKERRPSRLHSQDAVKISTDKR